jgi:cytochrome oxidase Cu insertion factor (SCO1/SenC/PrrC family)
MKRHPHGLTFAGAVIAVLFTAITAGGTWADGAPAAVRQPHLPPPGSYKLLRIMQMPDAPMLNASGHIEPLSGSTGGAITLLTFFYSTCNDPEGCPVSWSVFQEVRGQVSGDPALSGKVRLAFVSLDPERDGAATMALFQRSFTEAGEKVPWRFLTSPSAADLTPLLEAAGQDISVVPDPAGGRGNRCWRASARPVRPSAPSPTGWARTSSAATW